MVETLLEKEMPWLSGKGPESDVVLFTLGRLKRNLADFPFPGTCSPDERRRVEERILAALEREGPGYHGTYLSLAEMDEVEARVLVERGLVSRALCESEGARGVYISEDQSLAVMINGSDHLEMRCALSGLQPQQAWQCIDQADNQLAGALDYAFDDNLGFLTARLNHVGTGLTLSAVLHLPGLNARDEMLRLEQALRADYHVLEGYRGPLETGLGELYMVSNRATLGRTEEETSFYLRNAVRELVGKERDARKEMTGEGSRSLDDRIGRAQGIARGARVLEYDEAMGLMSPLRLGTALGLLEGYSLRMLNELEMASQRAHVELRSGHKADPFALSAERADMFRARLS